MAFGKLFGVAKKIPVLAYGADQGDSNSWQVLLRAQLEHLRAEGYQCLSIDDFLSVARAEKPAPDKAFMLTFDGAEMLPELLPLMENSGCFATVFVPAIALSGAHLQSFTGVERSIVQLAMGGFGGEDYSLTSLADAKENLAAMVQAFQDSRLTYHKIMAYPKGNMPKSRNDLILLKALMADAGIEAAFKIDAKPERTPSADLYEISRISASVADTPRQLLMKM